MRYERISQKSENYAVPVDSPAYGPQPTIYKNVEFNYVYFRCDPKNIKPLLPDFFQTGDEGICVAFSVKVPFSSCYGPFNEMGVVVEAVWKDKKCFYMPALYLDNDSAVAAGREIYGSPKKFAKVSIRQQNEILTATTTRAEIDILNITTKIIGTAKETDFISIFPIYNLKMIPSIEGPWPEVKQLTTCGIDEPITHYIYKCAGSVDFKPSCNSEIWRLAPLEIIGASRICMDYVQGYGKIVHDFLKTSSKEI